jgi:hypothetical protein
MGKTTNKSAETAEQKDRLSSLEKNMVMNWKRACGFQTHGTNGNAEEALASFISLHEIDLVLIDGERNGFPFLKNILMQVD